MELVYTYVSEAYSARIGSSSLPAPTVREHGYPQTLASCPSVRIFPAILVCMNIEHYTHPHVLERYAFIWSEARLIIAALALFLGGVPPIIYLLPSSLVGLTSILLKTAWLISGVVSVYLLYRWLHHGQRLFGGTDKRDLVAFLVLVISGINLGLVGLIGRNVGMSISSSYAIFVLVGIVYLVSAYHLYARRRTHGKLF